jgi:hypothetical protein
MDDCRLIQGQLKTRAAFELDEPAERRLRDHLAGCEACRSALTAEDPSSLFLELRGTPLPPAFWAGFHEGLRSRIANERAPAWSGWAALFRYPRLAYLTAPLAMLLILGAALFVVRPGGLRGFGGRLGRSGIRHPIAGSARPGRILVPETPRPFGRALPGGESGAGQPPVIEEVGSPGARVYRFNVGEPGDETPIYFVVDERIDL